MDDTSKITSDVEKLQKPMVIGIAGGTGSGKTTVLEAIVSTLGSKDVVVIAHDSYYKDRSHLPMEERVKINYDHPEALDTALLIQHVRQLQAGMPAEVPIYDFSTHTRRKEFRLVHPAKVILVEGILILANQELRSLFDIKIFVDTDPDIRFIRRMERDISERARTRESVVKQYMESVRPMHIAYVEPSKSFADVIVPEGGFNYVAIDMIITKIQSIIEGREFYTQR